MEIVFSPRALSEIQYWKKSGNTKVMERISLLIAEIQKDPFTGLGKPEALKHNYRGYWSRRITSEHRLIYKVEDSTILIAQVRYHY